METLEQKIGQMFVIGFRGLEVKPNNPIVADLLEVQPGGVILFDYDVELATPGRNIESPDQLRNLTAQLQGLSELPLLIAVDQEGGEVCRLKEGQGFPPSIAACRLGEIDDPAETRRVAERTAHALAEGGCNLNLAPSVDLCLNPDNPIIGRKGRSFGADPARVIRHAREVIRAHRKLGVGCAIKHFPGHGSSLGDTHLGFVEVTETWKEAELEPFEILISEGDCLAVMTAHVFHAGLDPEWPATLSERVIQGILRKRLGFDGVVLSDDMEMGAISSRYGLENAILQAVQAGVDLLVFGNNTVYQFDIGRRAVAIMKRLVGEGKIDETRIDESYRRILALKGRIGIL